MNIYDPALQAAARAIQEGYEEGLAAKDVLTDVLSALGSRVVVERDCPECGSSIDGFGGHVREANNEKGFERCPGPGGERIVIWEEE